MKGCLNTVLVLGVLAVLILAGGTCYLGGEVREFVQRMESGFAEARATDEAFPYTVDVGGELTEARLDAFLAVRDQVTGPTISAFDEVNEWARKEDVGILDTWNWAKKVRAVIEEIPGRLTEGLRAQQMGYSEYRWITEAMHGTLAAAAADPENRHPGATELVESFQDYFQNENRSVEGEVNGQDFDYPSVRDHLAEKYRDFRPENLERLLARAAQIGDPVARVMLDVLVMQADRDVDADTTAPSTETPAEGAPADDGAPSADPAASASDEGPSGDG